MSSAEEWQARALERRCTHCSRESQGLVYSGRDYLRVLQGLRGDEAERLGHRVEPFFWSDADMIHVRLCGDCVAHLGVDKVAEPLSPAPADAGPQHPFPHE